MHTKKSPRNLDCAVSDALSARDISTVTHQISRQARSAIAAVKGVAAFYRVPIHADTQIAHDAYLMGDFCAEDVVKIARVFGLKAKLASNQKIERLLSIHLPAIIELKDGSFSYLANRDPQEDKFCLLDPTNLVKSDVLSKDLIEIWTGKLILITRRNFGAGSDPRTYGFQWFTPTLWRYRGPLAHVLLASLFIQFFALATPLFFQLVFDKVLMHKGLETLTVLVIGLAIIGLFDALLQYLRSYALSHTASRIDAELGSRLFEHLMRLPISYFETRQTGQTVARVRELETVRQFLTGQGISSVIDTGFALILVAVLFIYSAKLALIVLFSAPCYILVSSLVRPVLRERTREKFNRSAQSQQFLVESVVGIQTIKAAAVEPVMRAEWDERLAAYLGTSFRTVMIGAVAQGGIQYISRLTTALILFFGAQEVMGGSLSIGELVAFNMIAGQITQPILRLSQLWQDFQQVRISVERIGDILNAPMEPRPPVGAALPPALKGAIRFEDAGFRYSAGGREILQGINLTIEPGQVIGVVGPSGSGKSTLTKLIQRLYVPTAGRVLLDGQDITEIDPGWLRRQVGVVLQENLLFNRTVHENIAFAYPGLAREQVVRVAKLAGAHEFIMCLPNGYDTEIEERGANLSGGQRQRIAIARALATNPRILIFDEATSALDYESEQIIQANMRDIVCGRTVIIVSHRLGAVRDCDRIISVGDGRIVEDGTHEELLTAAGGPYARFWGMQMRVARGGQ